MESGQILACQRLQEYREGWGLIPEADFFYTRSSLLQAVSFEGKPAMLKIPFVEEERRGANLMTWWAGTGAATVFKQNSYAILLERLLSSQPTLIEMVKSGQDEEATQIICSVAQKIHAIQKKPWPDLISLDRWFQDLEGAAQDERGMFLVGWRYAKELLHNQQEIRVLHGDLHHGNILHSDQGGWRVIDPKGLVGDRYFDYANLFCNPDNETAWAPGRFAKRLDLISKKADLHPERLLKWIVAWATLSATWSLADGVDAEGTLGIAALAIAKLTS